MLASASVWVVRACFDSILICNETPHSGASIRVGLKKGLLVPFSVYRFSCIPDDIKVNLYN